MSTVKVIQHFHMTSWQPYWCSRTHWNGGHVCVPNQYCGSWTLFLCKHFLLLHKFTDAGHVSENALYTVHCHLFFRKIEHLLFPGFAQILGFKIKDFFETYLQNDNFSFQTQGYQIGVNRDKKTLEQSLLHGVLQMHGRDWIRFDQNGQHFTSKALVVALKKKINKLQTFYHFSRLNLHFPDFFQVWKIAGQISRLFQEFKTLYEPCVTGGHLNFKTLLNGN